MFGGGLDWVLDLPVEEIVRWHPEAKRQFDLRAQSIALSVAQLFKRPG